MKEYRYHCVLKFLTHAYAADAQRLGLRDEFEVDWARRNWCPTETREPVVKVFDAGVAKIIDTLACRIRTNPTSIDVEAYFAPMPGFVALKDNRYMCFMKFETPEQAASAHNQGRDYGFEVSFTRNSPT